MVDKFKTVRDKPSVSKVEIFDSLLTISSLTKALAEDVMLLERIEDDGGNDDEPTKTLNLSSK